MRDTLSRAQAKAFYDRIGRRQDTQAFYERPAQEALIAHSAFAKAHRVFELGCGTGRFAARLLRDVCPPRADYTGVDLSPTMVGLAREALAPFAHRAEVVCTDGRLRFDRPAATYDRVVAAYVLDLLSDADIDTFLDEAHRLLAPGGRLCVAGLTWGRGLSRLGAILWDTVHAWAPTWVGGCRPIRVQRRLAPARWHVHHVETVTAFGIPSEVLIADAIA